jgi:hypothetical protein
MHGARLGERETGAQSQPFRRFIDGEEAFDIAALAIDGEGRLPFVMAGLVPAISLRKTPR